MRIELADHLEISAVDIGGIIELILKPSVLDENMTCAIRKMGSIEAIRIYAGLLGAGSHDAAF